MTMYLALNHAYGSGTAIGAGQSYTTNAAARCMIQLDVDTKVQVRLIEYGVSFDASTAATPAKLDLVQVGTGSTCTTAHVAGTSVLPIGDNTNASRLGYGSTADTGFGITTITSAAPEKYFDSQYMPPTGQFVKQWPLGREPVAASSKFVQLRISVSATVNAAAYIIWEEI